MPKEHKINFFTRGTTFIPIHASGCGGSCSLCRKRSSNATPLRGPVTGAVISPGPFTDVRPKHPDAVWLDFVIAYDGNPPISREDHDVAVRLITHGIDIDLD